MPSVLEKVTANAKLISLPDVYLRLKAVLEKQDYSMGEVADVISHDPAMTARLLRLVNSAYFGLAAKIDTVNRAVSLLGTQQVHDLVLAVSVADSFDGLSNQVMDMRRFWRNSVSCAIASKELAARCNVLDSERLFVAGLLRDIGHLILFQTVPSQIQQAMQHARKQGVPLYRVERLLLGIDYAKLGGTLMQQWQLPKSLWEPTECHVEPALAEEFPLIASLLHIAAVITDAVDEERDVSACVDRLNPIVWHNTGLTAAQCEDIPERVEKQFASVINLIFPAQAMARA